MIYETKLPNMLFILIFWCANAIVLGTNIRYTIESFTTDGKPCMTDCVNHMCITEWSGSNVSCDPGETPALRYYTVQDKTQVTWCVSRCVKFNNDSYDNRCYVSENKWDYCNAESAIEYIKNKPTTKSNGPCITKCAYRGYDYEWCNYYWDAWSSDSCEQELYTNIIMSKTIYGINCYSSCGKFLGSSSNLCIDNGYVWNRCAPPARDFSLLIEMFEKCRSTWHGSACHEQRGNISLLCAAGLCDGKIESDFVLIYADLLEMPGNDLFTQKVNESGNPIHTYTVMLPALKNDPMLPLVVRARVTNETLRTPKSNESTTIPGRVHKHLQLMGMSKGIEDEGRLIGYILGGPEEQYNFVPQLKSLRHENGSQWYDTVMHIHNFVNVTGGWADIIILVVYKNLPYGARADGFVMNVELYHPNNTLHDECKDKYYANDPVDEFFKNVLLNNVTVLESLYNKTKHTT